MAVKRVALVLSGGVSLGSYIAGALDELLVAFEASHNSDSSDQYVVDVITGASTGATTGSIIAHGLLFRGGKTLLHQVWVDRIDSQGWQVHMSAAKVSMSCLRRLSAGGCARSSTHSAYYYPCLCLSSSSLFFGYTARSAL